MSGRRSRSAAQRGLRAEKVNHEAEQDTRSDDDDDARAPKQPKGPERGAGAGNGSSVEALDASNLYAIVNRNSRRQNAL